MEGDRSLTAALALGATLLMVATACGVIERTHPKQSSGDQNRPGPLDTWLAVRSVRPDSETLSTRPRIEIRFNSYLEDDSFGNYNVGTLTSSGLSWGGWAEYVVTDKKIVWTPRATLPDGLEVTFGVAGRLRSVTGAPIRRTNNLAAYETDDEVSPPEGGRATAPLWGEISEIFDDHCNSCHGTAKWEGLVPLEYGALVGEKSAQVDRLLVRPFDAADSYLLQKLLRDYPELRYQPQPPPWSEEEPLSHREIRAVERWIDAGAPR